ncbi:hypothetical protein DFH07DRAFT_850894 [Mycena maculata]|uniref:Uncharacterized protein n=1 Tax=Mycena maculata TaxID=230809 RepID=A0AAD7HWE9_9AGAR|nr:hypothetical protein DFH07DRAFT_850894 [Mycena maculata]
MSLKVEASVNLLPAHVASLLPKIHRLLEQSSDKAILDLGASTDASCRLRELFLLAITDSISQLYDTVEGELQLDRTDDSLVVAAPTSFVADEDWDEYPEVANASVSFDVDVLKKAKTFHDFLLTPRIATPTSSLDIRTHVSPRHPRAVEIVPEQDQLVQLVYVPSLASLMYHFLRKMHGERLEAVQLDASMTQRLSAGPSIANSSIIMRSEADVEFHTRVTQGDIVSQGINYARRRQKEAGAKRNPLYPRKGTPIRRPGRQSHAFADLEIGKGVIEVKTIVSIDDMFIQKLFGFTPAKLKAMMREKTVGIAFDFHPPKSLEDDTIGSTAQSVVQLWAQLLEKTFSFGQGTSHEYSYFVVKDPQTPGRLIISPCYATFPKSDSPRLPSESGIYNMYNMFRIANNPEYSLQFLQKLRDDLSARDALIPAVFEDAGQRPPMVDLSKGTVGVKHVPNTKVLRDRPQLNYEEAHSSVEDAVEDLDQTDDQWGSDVIPPDSFAGGIPAHSTPHNAGTSKTSGPTKRSAQPSFAVTGVIKQSAAEQPGPTTRSQSRLAQTGGQQASHRGGASKASGSRARWRH